MISRNVALARLGAVAAVATNEEPLLREVRGALAAGVPAPDLHEVLLQAYLFVGFPRAINALIAFHSELQEPLAAPLADNHRADLAHWRERGEQLCRRVYGRNYERLQQNMQGLHPALAEWMVTEGYGKVLSRPHLDARERELAVLGILASDCQWRQLESHLRGALAVGATPAEVREVVDGVADLATPGDPPRMLALLAKVLGES